MSKVEFQGMTKLLRRLDKLEKDLIKDISIAVFDEALNLETAIKKEINQGPPRFGVEYTRNGQKRRRSAPGQPAKTDRGGLVKSIFTKKGENPYTFYVYTKHFTSKLLEFGTSKMEARPFMHPTYRKEYKKMSNNIFKALQKAFKKSRGV